LNTPLGYILWLQQKNSFTCYKPTFAADVAVQPSLSSSPLAAASNAPQFPLVNPQEHHHR
jgi:hypothetical protein